MYWPFATRWLEAMVWAWTLNSDHQIKSVLCYYRAKEWITGNHISAFSCRQCTSIAPVSVYLEHWFAVMDGAISERVEHHKQLISTFLFELLLSVPADEWQLWFPNLTAQTKISDVHVHTALPTMFHFPPQLLDPQIQHLYSQGRKISKKGNQRWLNYVLKVKLLG